MKIVVGKDKNEIVALNDKNKVLGKGYIYESIASEIYEKDRINYFIDIVHEGDDKGYIVRDFIVHELIKIAKIRRNSYPDYDARVYNCCLSNDEDSLKYYSRLKGFKHDEGMYILVCELEDFKILKNKMEFEVREDDFNSDEEIQVFINEHSKVFRNQPYNIEKIKSLKEHEGYKNIAIYDKGQIIGNVLVLVEDKIGVKYGLLEDMFVNIAYRNKGIGEYLVNRVLEYFKSLDIDEVRLEVWSSNIRAKKLYNKLGFQFLEESEFSIGMSI